MTIQKEENNSSNLAVTFIGFTEELVIEFIKAVEYDFKEDKNIKFLFIQSKDAGNKKDIVSKIKSNARAMIKSVWKEPYIKCEFVGNIYDFNNYLMLLKKYSIENNLILNVSAGPYAYTSAASIFGIMHGYLIYYNVVTVTNTTFFKPIDTKPLRYILNLAPIDIEILNILKDKKTCTVNELYLLMNKYGIKSTARNIQYRLNELEIKGIVVKNGKKPALYSINDFLYNLI
ncbi:hypothetical protein [Picrophilus oshimae]|uniref:CRISPR locus-related DNA-binding protein n=1 Tax=Picrophilus torridus (strain ATCC 700027 / DSM 9790 / JCM 10055 / NBRC 100828 / KAW 2/3) TaxID=1122961 RepID=Q6L356_PICTO|nr:hypothetical protein [Picrophilus oshimae]AAT42595.1 hypothetical protein PTO0010 [Picrophilus oshimae DSM 9789]